MKTSLLALFITLLLMPTPGHAEQNDQHIRLQQLKEINSNALKQYLSSGMDPNQKRDIAFVLSSNDPDKLKTLRGELDAKGLKVGKVWLLKKEKDREHHVLEIIFKQTLSDADKLLKYCQLIDGIAIENQVQFIGWAAAKGKK